ncbi:MAG TPA: cupin domain-containing protein [Anaeromyxobacteraceae bacterium]|nr:cupin domain-containing protein [Anaeromyxobacteraceae bacterium]
MAKMMIRRFATPDETRQFAAKGRTEILNFGNGIVGRGIFEPGWKWSKHARPITKTPSCMASHASYVVSGRMRIVMDDGTEAEIGPGDYALIPPGHDAWTVGNETCVTVDFAGMLGDRRPELSRIDTGADEHPGMH